MIKTWQERGAPGHFNNEVRMKEEIAELRAELDRKVSLIEAASDLLVALEALLNATMYKDHPEESHLAMVAIAKATEGST